MQITSIIDSYSPEIARSSLYYAARYIKQAENVDKYEKDIFEDGTKNLPTKEVRDLTLKVVAVIEEREGMKAPDFDDATVIRLLDEITDLESALSPELSDVERQHAAAIAAGMLPPE
ncbi:hypothetical protein ACMG4P_11915 [Pseudovibrio denitrificans]|uniref:hypothetical protein n=1 Tax=Pseudovibrio denitrificans TaxID=258256 RepID=UPI0039BF7FAA